MDDVGRYLWSIAIAVMLLIIALFLSMVKTAVATLTESRLKKLSEDEPKKAGYLLSIKEKEYNFSMWTKAGALICGMGSLTIIQGVLSDPLLLNMLGGNKFWAFTLAFFTSAFFVIILGFLVPSRIAGFIPEKVALKSVFFLKLIRVLTYPFTFLMFYAARLLVRVLGHNPDDAGAYITEDEIRMLVDAGNESGAIELDEREMINNVFEFGDRTVEEVMTHRTDIEAVSLTEDKVSDVLNLAIDKGHSRIPVYGDDIDDIVGIVYAKDLLTLVGKTDIDSEQLQDYMHEPIFVPEAARCGTLFKQLKNNKTHMAVVVDEYGGTAGIATMEDLIESIVGDIQDEYDSEEEEIIELSDGTYSLDGAIQLKKLEELLDTDFEIDEDTDTLGGLITNTLGRIPSENEHPVVTVNDIEFTVAKAEERRILRVIARKIPKTEISEE